MKKSIFISYSRKDSDWVIPIVNQISEKGLSVWIDKNGIESGDAFKSVIVKAIKNSEVFLFFSSKNANESIWTLKEVNTAVYLKKYIIPIKLDNAEYNDSILFDLVDLDYVDLANEEKRNDSLDKLINTLSCKITPKEGDNIEDEKSCTTIAQADIDNNDTSEEDAVLPIDECYTNGIMCFESQKYLEAIDWFKKAAKRGHASSQCYLGYIYENGFGIARSEKEAMTWYTEAAEQGDALAQNNLGSMYREQKNAEEAVKWFRLAAGQEHVLAQYNLAIMYLVGSGVPQDEAEAVKWYRRAAEQGLPQAQFSLGNMYRTGSGLKEKDESEAVMWFKKAAEQGLADAQHNLGYMYYNGCGIERDVNVAVNWLKKAAAQGHSGAKSALKMIMDSMQQ